MPKKIYIYSDEWFESTMLCNPFISLDHKLEDLYPNYWVLFIFACFFIDLLIKIWYTIYII